MNILAIETSCDETAAAVIKNGTEIISNVVASSRDFHEKYGGVLPELAARKQLEFILPVLTSSLKAAFPQPFNNVSIQQCINENIDALAVTIGPGLIGSLLIGVETAKTLAYLTGKPLIPVNHVLAHMYANFISRYQTNKFRNPISEIRFPAISLVVSGGHTELYLMKTIKSLIWLGGTLDDAAGECFDKTARLLLFGNRGGLAIQEAALKHLLTNYSRNRVTPAADSGNRITRNYELKLPRPMIHDKSLNFSFSGLKTAVLREINRLQTNEQFNNVTIQQLSFEIQEAITDVLVSKTLKAAQMYEAKSILLSGGVAANLKLRKKFQQRTTNYANDSRNRVAPAADSGNRITTNYKLFVPPMTLCTDNAACIGSYAFFRGSSHPWRTIKATPNLTVEN